MNDVDRVLREVRVGRSFICRCELTAPWGLSFPERRVIGVHMLAEGGCEVAVEGATPINLQPGDLVFLPRGAAHVLRDAPSSGSVPFDSLDYGLKGDTGAVLRHGGAGGPSVLLCVAAELAGPGAALIARALPSTVVLRQAAGPGTLAAALIAAMGQEASAGRPGAAPLMSGLGAALVLSVLRDAWAARGVAGPVGGALDDERVRGAVLAMHEAPGRRWTVESLADHVGMSRSAFAAAFAAAMEQTPIQYLTRLRVQRARELLREPHRSLYSVAVDLGYGSPEAFTRAFRRETGMTPGQARGAV